MSESCNVVSEQIENSCDYTISEQDMQRLQNTSTSVEFVSTDKNDIDSVSKPKEPAMEISIVDTKNKPKSKKKHCISGNMKSTKKGIKKRKKKKIVSDVSGLMSHLFTKKDRNGLKKQANQILESVNKLTSIVYSLRDTLVVCSLTLPDLSTEALQHDLVQHNKWKELVAFGNMIKPIIKSCEDIKEAIEKSKKIVNPQKMLELIMSDVVTPLSVLERDIYMAIKVCNEFSIKYVDDIDKLGTKEAELVSYFIRNILPTFIESDEVKENVSEVLDEVVNTDSSDYEYVEISDERCDDGNDISGDATTNKEEKREEISI